MPENGTDQRPGDFGAQVIDLDAKRTDPTGEPEPTGDDDGPPPENASER